MIGIFSTTHRTVISLATLAVGTATARTVAGQHRSTRHAVSALLRTRATAGLPVLVLTTNRACAAAARRSPGRIEQRYAAVSDYRQREHGGGDKEPFATRTHAKAYKTLTCAFGSRHGRR